MAPLLISSIFWPKSNAMLPVFQQEHPVGKSCRKFKKKTFSIKQDSVILHSNLYTKSVEKNLENKKNRLLFYSIIFFQNHTCRCFVPAYMILRKFFTILNQDYSIPLCTLTRERSQLISQLGDFCQNQRTQNIKMDEFERRHNDPLPVQEPLPIVTR